MPELTVEGDDKGLKDATCLDCSKPYSQFGLDVVLPYSQWKLINEDVKGLLCAQCIVNRVSKINGAIVIHAVIEFTQWYNQSKTTINKQL